MLCTLVDNVRSRYNVGTIFRTADGAGVDKLLLTGITASPPHRELRKVALGAEETVSWEYHKEWQPVIRRLKEEGFKIVVLETTETAVPFDMAEYTTPLCLVVGNEYHGVSQGILQAADLVIRIPMNGIKNSLNVGVAFGIAIYHIKKDASLPLRGKR